MLIIMFVCSCNLIKEEEIRSVISDMLRQDAWQLIIPLQVYHEMGKRGRCCGCFPRLVELIVETTETFHRHLKSNEAEVVRLLDKLKSKHQQCETARKLARQKMLRRRVA